MSCNQGFSTRLPYDQCAYVKDLTESTAPYSYQMYDGKYENCKRCVFDKYPRPFDGDIVDIESELRNQTRNASKCPSKNYGPTCQKSSQCVSTFDKSVPVVLAPEVCPIVFNNLKWGNDTGVRQPPLANCGGIVVGK